MTKTKLPIEFSLQYLVRRDEEAKVYVGYIPILRLYTQARDQARLKDAIVHTVTAFVGMCFERGILDDVMRERGMKKTRHKGIKDLKKSGGGQYIKVGAPERDLYQEFPTALLATKQETVECHH